MSDDLEWRERFGKIAPVPMTEELKATILRKAAVQSGRRQISEISRSLLASLAAVSAASVLVWGAWHYGGRMHGQGMEPGIAQQGTAHANLASAERSYFGLSVAPISVGFTVPSDEEKGLVVATLTNVGTEVIKPEQVVGLLSFQTQNHTDALKDATWATFVDPPKQPLEPGQTLTWSFRPIGVPQDESHHFQGRPKLIFLKRGFVSTDMADMRWQKAPLQLSRSAVQVRQRWASGQSFTVHTDIQNMGKTPVQLNHVMAIIWFSNQPGEDWTDGNATRFMYQLAPLNSGTLLAPGARATVNFRLIGPPDLDVSGIPVHVAFIWR